MGRARCGRAEARIRNPHAARAGLLGVLVVTAIAAALRVPRWGLDPISDELSLFSPEGLRATLWQPEDGVNPPLLQLGIKAFPASVRLEVGRALAVAASILAVPLVARLTWRVTGRWLAVVAAAAVLAVHPRVVVETTLFRAYAFVLVALLLHLDALVRRERGGGRARWLTTLALLPWLHYLALPLAGVELVALALRPARRGDVVAAWPAAVAWTPLLVWVVTLRGAHRASVDAASAVLGLLATGLEPHQAPWVVVAVVAVLAVALARLRHLDLAERTLVVGSAAVVGVVGLAAAVQTPREGVAVFLLAPLLPLVAGGVPWPEWVRPAVGLAVGAAFVGLVGTWPAAWREPGIDRRAYAEAVALLPTLDVPAGGDVLVPDAPGVEIVHDRMTGRHRDPGEGCDGVAGPCFVLDGRRYRVGRHEGDVGLWVRPHGDPTGPPAGCDVDAVGAHVDLLRCGG